MKEMNKNAIPKNSWRFDWLVIGVITWFWSGFFLDGWAHNNLQVIDTFFSPWHAVFYSGFFAVLAVFLGNILLNVSKGYSLKNALPKGYNISILGFIIFGAAGFSDMVWHELFGFELDINALLSPVHLFLAVGGDMIVLGVILSQLNQNNKSLFSQLPLVIAVAYFLSVINNITQYSHPLTWVHAEISSQSQVFFQTTFIRQALGATSILFQTTLLMASLLFLLIKKRLIPGMITIIFIINGAAMISLRNNWELLLPVLIAGVVSDFLLFLLKPKIDKSWDFYLFAFLVPVIYYSTYFTNLFIVSQVWWSIHSWAGTIIKAGLTGFILAVLFRNLIQEKIEERR